MGSGTGVAVGSGVAVGCGVAVGTTVGSGVEVGCGVGSGSALHATRAVTTKIAMRIAMDPAFQTDFNSSPFGFQSIDARDLLRANKSKKNGAPTRAVTTPTGISAGATATLASVSAASRNIPPPMALNGTNAR